MPLHGPWSSSAAAAALQRTKLIGTFLRKRIHLRRIRWCRTIKTSSTARKNCVASAANTEVHRPLCATHSRYLRGSFLCLFVPDLKLFFLPFLFAPIQFSPGQATMDRLSNATQVGGGARTVDELSGVQAMPLWTYKYSPEGGKSTGPLNLHPYLDSGDCTMSKIMQEPEMGHHQTTFGANHGNSSGNNNVSILSSILVTNGQGSSADNPGGGRGTLKKRVQIQELPM